MAPKKKPTPSADKKRKTTSPASATKKRATPLASSSLPTMVTRSAANSERIRLVEGLKSDSDVKRKANKAKAKSASRKKKAKPDDAPPKVNEAAGGSGKGKEPDVGGAVEEDAGTEEEEGDDDGDDEEEEPGGGKGISVIIMAWDIGLLRRKAEELKDCMGGATPDMILRMNPEMENFPDEQLLCDLKLDENCEGINWMTFHRCIRKEASELVVMMSAV